MQDLNSARNRQQSYNIMNDDIDNDIDIQIEIQDLNNSPSIPKLFFLQNSNSSSKNEEQDLYINNNSMEESNDNIKLYNSNSPSSISSNSSENSRKTTYKKLTYEEVEHSLQKHFKTDKLFSELDVLITYIKGQKHIYSQSFYITQQKVNLLVFPSLFITSVIMVIAPIIQEYSWSGYLLTGLNAILTLFISILNFWNLQYNMTQYSTFATHFDRLETSLVMTRNQIYLLDDIKEQTDTILHKLRETENRMMEMKDSTSILIPTEIKHQTPIISNFDIFAFIHKTEQCNKKMIIHYKDIKNEIRNIMFKWKSKDRDVASEIDDFIENKDLYYSSQIHNDDSFKKESERNRLLFLLKEKESIKHKLLENHQTYSKIEEAFLKEIYIAEKNQHNFWFLFSYYLCNYSPQNNTYTITITNELESL